MFLNKNKLFRIERGDTIVEVLVVIAVISSVMGGAYALARRSTQNQQDAREQTKAVSLAEGQLEQLRAFTASSEAEAAPLFSTTKPFCMISGNAYDDNFSGAIPGSGTYPDTCKLDDDGATGRYRAAIIRNGNTFTANIDWEGVHGPKHVSISYKVYP